MSINLMKALLLCNLHRALMIFEFEFLSDTDDGSIHDQNLLPEETLGDTNLLNLLCFTQSHNFIDPEKRLSYVTRGCLTF